MSAALGVAAALGGLAAWLVVPGRPHAPWPQGTLRATERPPQRFLTMAAAAMAVFGVLWLVDGRQLLLAAVVAGAGWGVLRLLVRTRRAARADRRAEQVMLACDGIAADLTAGQPPLVALQRAAADWPELTPVALAAQFDADVPGALRAMGALPGGSQLRTVAAAWQVAHRSGAGLALALGQAATVLREDRRTMRMVSSELAAARTTAQMIGALPLLALLLGMGIGGDPIGFLTGTSFGLGCLATGLMLSYLGMVWLNRIADSVLGR
jgi:tight adherence protein B